MLRHTVDEWVGMETFFVRKEVRVAWNWWLQDWCQLELGRRPSWETAEKEKLGRERSGKRQMVSRQTGLQRKEAAMHYIGVATLGLKKDTQEAESLISMLHSPRIMVHTLVWP